MNILRTVLAVALSMVAGTAMAAGLHCEQLAKLALPTAKIDMAQSVPAGDFTAPPNANGRRVVLTGLPAFCRIAATLTPTSDSDIKVEVWLPETTWNGKYQAEGNGGWAGVISYAAMGDALKRGYATSSTDTGHSTPGGSFVLGHPEKWIDFGWRSEHEMAVKAKAVVSAFYGNSPKYSYWNGCSTGGRQGLKEATQFPDDFDGIVAGDPATPRAHWYVWELESHVAIDKDGAPIPKEKLPMIHQAVLAACDARDGVKDGLIDSPRACKFDYAALLCKGADTSQCLTQKEVSTAKVLTSPGVDGQGHRYWSGWERGSELNWDQRGLATREEPTFVDEFKYVVYKDANWDYHSLDSLDSPDAKTLVKTVTKLDSSFDVFQTDMSKFAEHGGKLISYHGWNDTQVSPGGSLDYYAGVQKTMGKDKTEQFMRLFMVPGMGHCQGGEGAPSHFDSTAAIEQWVEHGKAPEQMLGRNIKDGKVTRTRPLCAYPNVATYTGTGSTDDAANFVCKGPG